jgi:hypothetical protein
MTADRDVRTVCDPMPRGAAIAIAVMVAFAMSSVVLTLWSFLR